jgi:2-polyprenyl-3-methyl-5-hydroxy-6-metoxy-1,4-benzoquinol methylase
MTSDAQGLQHTDVGDRALRDALVRAGWGEALMLERLGPDRSREILADHLAAHVEQARASLKPLTPWPAQPERVTKVLNDDGNQTRIRRTLDYVMPGDRVLEVGVGFGQVSGLLLRDTGISGYTGIDIGQHRLDAVHQMAEKNGLDHMQIETALVDLLDLTPEWVGERAPNLIMTQEVLEHVPDAEGALAALARSMGPDCCVLFTVPVLGRIEACWGHLSLFDVARVQRMLADAGLVAQHVEVVYDAWLFVLASTSEAVPERVMRLASLARPTPPPPPPAVPLFVPIALGDAKAINGANTVEVTNDGDGAHVRVAGRRGKNQHGGLTFDIAGDIALRFELRVDTPKDVQRLCVDFYDDGGKRLARWTWDTSRSRMAAGKARTYVLKPGEPFGPFRPDGEVVEGRATRAGVLVEIAGKTTAKFTILRAAAVEEKKAG